MTADTQGHIHSLFQYYRNLTYWDKLNYYDNCFGLTPFQFPNFDVRISWFTDEDKMHQLIDNFYKEIRTHNLLETLREEDGKQLIFNVKPSSLIQRIQYNKFLFSKFVISDDQIKKGIASELEKTNDQTAFLETEIQSVHSTVAWLKNILQNRKTKFILKHQFLRLVYSGVNSYSSAYDLSGIRNRRKFVEVYLYAQGIFIARTLHWLQYFLEEGEMNMIANKG